MVFSDKVDVIRIDDGGFNIDIRSMKIEGKVIRDSMGGNDYMVTSKPVRLTYNGGKKGRWAYLLDPRTGATVEMKAAGGLIELRTDPDLHSKVLDSEIIKSAFNIHISKMVLFICVIIGFILGSIVMLLVR